MNKIIRYARVVGLVSIFAVPQLCAFVATSLSTPYDPVLRMPHPPEKCRWSFGGQFEYADADNGRNWDGKEANVLKLHDVTQSAIAMFKNPMATINTPAFKLVADAVTLQIPDNGLRGNIDLKGSFDGFAATPYLRWYTCGKVIPGRLSITAYVPVKHLGVHIDKWTDLTPVASGQNPGTVQDLEAIRLLTGTQALLQSRLSDFGGLTIDDWNTTALGDAVLMLDWYKDYHQDKGALKNVCVHAKAGVSMPTGQEKDEDEALSMATGYDGAWAIPLGLGLDLEFKGHFKLGIEGELEIILDETKTRRMKTYEHQTEFFLLNKGKATKEYGLQWKFYAYLQAFHLYEGFSLKVAYEYTKHDADKLKPKTNEFSYAVVNTAHSLGEMNLHSIIASINYDFFSECKNVCFKPQINFFYKLPVAGRNIIDSQTFGGQLTFSF